MLCRKRTVHSPEDCRSEGTKPVANNCNKVCKYHTVAEIFVFSIYSHCTSIPFCHIYIYMYLVHHLVSKGLNFERDLEIVLIEQLKSQANLTEKQQKELLKNRDFPAKKTRDPHPSGLSKREG